MSEEAQGKRLDRVESEVAAIRTEFSGLNTVVTNLTGDVRALSGILQRIEEGVSQAHKRFDNERQASRLNPVALATVLLSIITVLIGGAWLISGDMARQDERSRFHERLIDQIEQRQWEARGVSHAGKDQGSPVR